MLLLETREGGYRPRVSMQDAATSFALRVVGFFLLAFATACTPSIGDKCVLSTDCSLRGDRLCDTSQPGGYCTIFNCRGNLCPDYAICAEFDQNVQGCMYNDRTPSRTGRTFCMAQCSYTSDCRQGYICADIRNAPWNARVLDDNQVRMVCIPPPDEATNGNPDDPNAPVCRAAAPPVPPISVSEGGVVDANMSVNDAGAPDASDAADAGD